MTKPKTQIQIVLRNGVAFNILSPMDSDQFKRKLKDPNTKKLELIGIPAQQHQAQVPFQIPNAEICVVDVAEIVAYQLQPMVDLEDHKILTLHKPGEII